MVGSTVLVMATSLGEGKFWIQTSVCVNMKTTDFSKDVFIYTWLYAIVLPVVFFLLNHLHGDFRIWCYNASSENYHQTKKKKKWKNPLRAMIFYSVSITSDVTCVRKYFFLDRKRLLRIMGILIYLSKDFVIWWWWWWGALLFFWFPVHPVFFQDSVDSSKCTNYYG